MNARPRPAVRLRAAWEQRRCRRRYCSTDLIGSPLRVEVPFSGHEYARYCRGEGALQIKFGRKNTKLTSKSDEDTENVCISVNVCVSFCFSPLKLRAQGGFSDAQQSKIPVMSSKGSSVFGAPLRRA